METINLPKASALTSPNPVTLVCTQKPDGSTNLATVSWWTYLSFNPSMIAYAMAKTSFSGEMVRKNKKVILTIPGAAIKEAVMGCGMSTGRNTDKIEKLGIEMQSVPGSDIQVPAHTRVAIQCTLKEFHEVGDHYLYTHGFQCSAASRKARRKHRNRQQPTADSRRSRNTAKRSAGTGGNRRHSGLSRGGRCLTRFNGSQSGPAT